VLSLTEKIDFIRRVFGSYQLQRNEKNIAVKCPLCGNTSSDKKKLVIRLEDDLCHCWVCGYKARSLVHLLKKFSRDDLREYVDKFYDGKKNVDIDDVEKRIIRLPDDFRLLVLSKDDNDPDTKAAIKYCQRRGLSDRDLWFYKLGISNDRRWYRRVIVPSFDREGKLNDFVGRTIGKNVLPKYDSPGHDKLGNIFNELYVDWSKQLVLCEGPFDAMKCGDNVVPLLGAELNEESLLFERIVVNNTPVALALDADMEEKIPLIVKKLEEYDVSVVVVRVDDDPGALTREQFAVALRDARPLTWFNSIQEKLQRAVLA